MPRNAKFAELVDILGGNIEEAADNVHVASNAAYVPAGTYHRYVAIGTGVDIEPGHSLEVYIFAAEDAAGNGPAMLDMEAVVAPVGEARNLVAIAEAVENDRPENLPFIIGEVEHDDDGGVRLVGVVLLGIEPMFKPADGEDGWFSGTTTPAPTTTVRP